MDLRPFSLLVSLSASRIFALVSRRALKIPSYRGCLRSLCDACRCGRLSLSSYKTLVRSYTFLFAIFPTPVLFPHRPGSYRVKTVLASY